MKTFLVFTIYIWHFYHTKCAEQVYFKKHSGYTIDNTQGPYKAHFDSQSGLICLAHCKRESVCLTASYNEQTRTCSLYESKIDPNYLVTKLSSVVYTIKKDKHSINYTQPRIKVNSSNGASLTAVLGIIEITNDTSYFIITDFFNNTVLKLNENGEFIKSTKITYPCYITKSQKYIYVNSWPSSIIKLNYDLDQISTVVNDSSMYGIHYDLSNNNIYVASYYVQPIYIYHTIDEVNFTKIATIVTSYDLRSITINNDRIYTGTINGTILVYNKSNYSLIQVIDNICPNTYVESVKFDFNENMIYSCYDPPMVKIKGINGINTTLLLNDTFNHTYETYIDSKKRLWVGGNNGFIIYS